MRVQLKMTGYVHRALLRAATGVRNGSRSSAVTAGLLLTLLASGGTANAQSAAFQPAEWDKTVAAAKKEGKVVLYHIMVPPVVARVKADFEKAYPGIELEETRLPGSAILTKFDQERSAGADGADVTVTAELVWLEARAKEGSLKLPAGPSRSYPPAYLIGGAAPVVQLDPLVMVYNTSLVKGEIKTYRDLLRPDLKGKVGSTEAFSVITVAWYNWLEKTQGADFLPKFAAQGPRLYTGAVPSTQAVASGEIAVAMYTVSSVVQSLVEKGAPLKVVVAAPNLATANAAAAFSWAKRPNAGAVFLDYIMSPRGQTILHGGGGSASPLPGIPGAMNSASINTVDLRPLTTEVVKANVERLGNILKTR